jgi:hypothetical protein
MCDANRLPLVDESRLFIAHPGMSAGAGADVVL